MDSALRPREIQARIRAGQTLADVARVAGVPEDEIEPYAGPVIAEREHVAGLALASTVRRRGETATHRNLRATIEDRLTSVGVDIDDVDWDAWRRADKRWNIRAEFPTDEGTEEGLFLFDLAGRFAVASNDPARWLIGELTDDDELALVRAVSSDGAVPGVVPTQALKPQPAPATQSDAVDTPTQAIAEEPDIELTGEDADRWPASTPSAKEVGEQVEAELDADAYHFGASDSDDAETGDEDTATSLDEEARSRSELDVLYDMLGGMAEDSINIYAGLDDTPPISADPAEPYDAEPYDDDAAAVDEAETDDEVAQPQDSTTQLGASASDGTVTGTSESTTGATRTSESTTGETGTEDEVYDPSADPHFDPNNEPTVVRTGRKPRSRSRDASKPSSADTAATPAAAAPVDPDSAPPAEPHQPTLDEFIAEVPVGEGDQTTTSAPRTQTGTAWSESPASSKSEPSTSGPSKSGGPAATTPAAKIAAAGTTSPRPKSTGSTAAGSTASNAPTTATTASSEPTPAATQPEKTQPSNTQPAKTQPTNTQPTKTQRADGQPDSQPADPAEATKRDPDESQNEETTALPAAKRRKKKRASVPSWDEIMFGGPPPKK